MNRLFVNRWKNDKMLLKKRPSCHSFNTYMERLAFCAASAIFDSWGRRQMETFSALLANCAGNSPLTGEFSTQRPVTRSFDLRLNKPLSKQSWGWWFEKPSHPLWRHCDVDIKPIFTYSNKAFCLIDLGSTKLSQTDVTFRKYLVRHITKQAMQLDKAILMCSVQLLQWNN